MGTIWLLRQLSGQRLLLHKPEGVCSIPRTYILKVGADCVKFVLSLHTYVCMSWHVHIPLHIKIHTNIANEPYQLCVCTNVHKYVGFGEQYVLMHMEGRGQSRCLSLSTFCLVFFCVCVCVRLSHQTGLALLPQCRCDKHLPRCVFNE